MNLKLERYLRVNLLGPDPRLMKKNLSGRGLTNFEKYCARLYLVQGYSIVSPSTTLQDMRLRNILTQILSACRYFFPLCYLPRIQEY